MNRFSTKDISPEAISFIPLFFVGWSDSVLSPTEIDFIQERINNYDFLNPNDKSYLLHWCNPQNPPTSHEFTYWLNLMRQVSWDLNDQEKFNMIELGLRLAKKNNQRDLHNSVEVVNALKEIYNILGLNEESDHILLDAFYVAKESEAFHKPNFDPKILKAHLDGQNSEVKDNVRKLLKDPLFGIEHFETKEAHRKSTLLKIKNLAKQGLGALAFPESYGGTKSKGSYIAAYEMLGYGDLSAAIKFGVQFGLFGGALYQLGTNKHHSRYLKQMMDGNLLGCFAMTETGHGSNVKGLETTATYNHEDRSLTINSPTFQSGKEYIGNALDASMSVIFAQLIVNDINHGVHAILVPLRDSNHDLLPGIKIEDNGYKLGLNGVDNGRIWYNHVQVPVDNLLNKFGNINEAGEYESPIKSDSKRFFTMLGALVAGRICVGLLGLNASKTALTIALRYAQMRKQFAPNDKSEETRLIQYPTHQKRLFPLLAKNVAYTIALDDLATNYLDEDNRDIRKIETLAAGLKAKASWLNTDTIQICREACGGKGYLVENRFAALKSDSDIFTTFEGDNTVLMQLVAKGILTDFKQSFHDEGYRAVIRFLLSKVKYEAQEYDLLRKRNTERDHLLSEEFHKHAFNFRTQKILIALSDRMRKYLKRGMDPYQAFLKVQIHMVDLADAHIDEIALNAFYERIKNIEDIATRNACLTLVQLYALTIIEEEKGWFLETDYFDGVKTKAIRRVITKLNQSIKININGYLKAFDIPDEMIAAPIAFNRFS